MFRGVRKDSSGGGRKEYYGGDFTAATWVQVQRLYLPSFGVEVEVTAVFPNPAPISSKAAQQ
jgi:hypothetical protein